MVSGSAGKKTAGKRAGQRLREARLARRLTVDDVAVRIRIPPKQLRALEEGNLTVFSAEIYAKGAYTKYASYLGVDSKDAWHYFLRTLAGVKDLTGSIQICELDRRPFTDLRGAMPSVKSRASLPSSCVPRGRCDERVRSSVVERCPDKTEVGGSTPPAPTKLLLPILFFNISGEVFVALESKEEIG